MKDTARVHQDAALVKEKKKKRKSKHRSKEQPSSDIDSSDVANDTTLVNENDELENGSMDYTTVDETTMLDASETMNGTDELTAVETKVDGPENLQNEDQLYPKLGSQINKKLTKQKFLPEWVEQATPVSRNIQADKIPLEEIGHIFSPYILERLQKLNITHLFPVQKLVVAELLDKFATNIGMPCRDVCVSAPTGSGKTFCFVLPVVQSLVDIGFSLQRRIRALVVLPVVDLAKQVLQVFQAFTENTPLKCVLLAGQHSLESEIEELYSVLEDGTPIATADIVVATPGRLLEHINESGGAFVLRHLRFLIVDEADRLMRDFRSNWVQVVERSVYATSDDSLDNGSFFGKPSRGQKPEKLRRQGDVPRCRPDISSLNALFGAGRRPLRKIFLSATLSYDPGQLQKLRLFRPKLFSAHETVKVSDGVVEPLVGADRDISIGDVAFPTELKEYKLICDANMKPLVLHCLLQQNKNWKRILCFANTRRASDRLSILLAKLGTVGVRYATAELARTKREKLLKSLHSGTTRMLICSDVMARGMDISNVDCVINYDTPREMRSYIHRAGRTARAGHEGSVITLCTGDEDSDFFNNPVMKHRKSSVLPWIFDTQSMSSLKNEYTEALKGLKEVVKKTKTDSLKRSAEPLKTGIQSKKYKQRQ